MSHRRELHDQLVKRLGTVPDAKIAAEMRVAPTTVFKWRKLRGIPAFQPKHKDTDEPSEEEIEAVIAEQTALIPTLDWWDSSNTEESQE